MRHFIYFIGAFVIIYHHPSITMFKMARRVRKTRLRIINPSRKCPTEIVEIFNQSISKLPKEKTIPIMYRLAIESRGLSGHQKALLLKEQSNRLDLTPNEMGQFLIMAQHCKKYAIKRNPFINREGSIPHLAAYSKCPEILENAIFYCEKPIDIDQKNKHGNTGLYIASQIGHIPTMNILLDHHADPTSKNEYGKGPIHASIEGLHIPATKKLLQHDQNTIYQKDSEDKTPMDTINKKLRMLNEYRIQSGYHACKREIFLAMQIKKLLKEARK